MSFVSVVQRFAINKMRRAVLVNRQVDCYYADCLIARDQ